MMRLWIFAAGLVVALTPYCLAQDRRALPVRPCTPSDIDAHALPPATTRTFPRGHLIVLEIRNIGPSSCGVDQPVVALLPQVHFADETYAFRDHEGPSAMPGPYLIEPEEWVHVVVAWISDAPPEVQCLERSGLRVLFLRGSPGSPEVSVEVRGAGVRSCSAPYISMYRRGHYSPDSRLPALWIPASSAERVDEFRLPVQATWDRIQRPSPWFRADAPSTRTMLRDPLVFRIRFQRQADGGCPYRLVRMRESSGRTAIVVAQCPRDRGGAELESPQYGEAGVLRLDLGRLGLLPTHAGAVEYNVISAGDPSERHAFGEARVALTVHDPDYPAQAAIAQPLPLCTVPQLLVAALPAVVRERWKTLRAYEATNLSDQACSVAGVPLLRTVGPGGSRMPIHDPALCPNCPNALFSPRPNGRIDLKPGEKAHFLFGATAINTDDDPWMHCESTGALMLWPSADNAPNGEPAESGIALRLDARVCAGADVSTWRAGAFDGDPHNLRRSADRRLNVEDSAPGEPACRTAELPALGTPRFAPAGPQLAFGISAPRTSFVPGERITLPLWVKNTAEVPVDVMTCAHLGFFRFRGFDLYDAYGHRVLDQAETRFVERCRTEPGAAELMMLFSCTRNFAIPIPAHTCLTKPEYDFTVEVSERFRLPAGEYTLRFRDNRLPYPWRCGSADGPAALEGLGSLTFSVVQP